MSALADDSSAACAEGDAGATAAGGKGRYSRNAATPITPTWAGRPVRVGEQRGVARGVSTRGELLLETAAGLLPVSGGELSLRLETSP